MTVQRPKITGDTIVDSWSDRVTQNINNNEARLDDLASSIRMVSPDGTEYLITMNNGGTLRITEIV